MKSNLDCYGIFDNLLCIKLKRIKFHLNIIFNPDRVSNNLRIVELDNNQNLLYNSL